jgi:hypothetical protein
MRVARVAWKTNKLPEAKYAGIFRTTPHRDPRAQLHVEGPSVLRLTLIGLGLVFAALIAAPVLAVEFHPIRADAESTVVTLTGHDLTIEEVVAVARHGAHVRYSPEAIERAVAGGELRAEDVLENVPGYGVNRGAGAPREVRTHRSEVTQLTGRALGGAKGYCRRSPTRT